MKRILAITLALLLILGLAACGNDDTNSQVSLPPLPENVHTENGVSVETTAFPENTLVKVEPIQSDTPKMATVKAALPKALEIVAYEITATSNNVAVQPDGTVAVTFPLPAKYDENAHDVAVFYVADDGQAEKVPTAVINGAVQATLPHFSTYAVALVTKEEETTTAPSGTATTKNMAAPTTDGKPKVSTTTTTTTTSTTTTTTTTKAPEATVNVSGKSYERFELLDNGNLARTSINFGKEETNALLCEHVTYQSYDAFYEEQGVHSGLGKEELLEEKKNNGELLEYKGNYYWCGMGGPDAYEIISLTPGTVTFKYFEGEGDPNKVGTLKYTSSGDTITITAINGIALSSPGIAVGDVMTLI